MRPTYNSKKKLKYNSQNNLILKKKLKEKTKKIDWIVEGCDWKNKE